MNVTTCSYCGAENYTRFQSCNTCQTENPQKPLPPSNKPRFKPSMAPNNPPRYRESSPAPEPKKRSISVFRILLLFVFVGIAGLIYANFFSIDKVSAISAFDRYYYGVNPPSGDDIKSAVLINQATLFQPYSAPAPMPEKYPVAVEAYEIESLGVSADTDGRIAYSAKYKALIKLGNPYLVDEKNPFGVMKETYESYSRVEGGIILYWNKYTKTWEKPEKQKK